MRKRALVTGITGQDGSYLTELLLAKDYEVHGIIRRTSTIHTERIDHLYEDPQVRDRKLFLYYGDMLDTGSIHNIVAESQPDEIYNLAAQSHVRVSFDIPAYTADSIFTGTINLLEAVRSLKLQPRFYQAGSSEMFGNASGTAQNEQTRFEPQSPYACAKVASHHLVKVYRESYDLFACNGILFNHESPRRGATFVTRKITMAVANILAGNQSDMYLGNLDSRRDWGYAKEYVEAMWLMLQQPTPDDFVIATGETHSVQEYLDLAFELAGLDPEQHVKIDPRYFRPSEVHFLLGDASKAKDVLGWSVQTRFADLVRLMLESDMALAGVDPVSVLDRKAANKSDSA